MKNYKTIIGIIAILSLFGCSKKEVQENISEPLFDTVEITEVPETVDIRYILEIEYSTFPLPEKYRNIISSGDKLRDGINDPNSGGQITSAAYHNALDIPVPDKTPVKACKDGYVKNVYPSYYNGSKWKGHPTYGGYIEIIHYDHTKSIYAHLSFTEVREGTYVKRGQEIGWSGGVKGRRGSGVSTGPHLHWSVMLDLESTIE